MTEKFKARFESSFPQLKEQSFLIACSGGLDSVVLTHLCDQCDYTFALAHANFQLRGQESEQEVKFVESLAEKLGVNIFVKDFDTVQYAKKNKLTIQVAARVLRYGWFSDLIEEKGYGGVLTAHHADDALETFLINLSRGTGLKGLSGIPPGSRNVYRPLLAFSREEIASFAKERGISWREDSSNAEKVYLRNRIRHELIPGIKSLHPAFLENFIKTQANLQAANDILDSHIEIVRGSLLVDYGDHHRIAVDSLKKLHPRKSYLFWLFYDYGFTDWDSLEQLLESGSGKEVRSATHRLIRDRQALLLAGLPGKEQKPYFLTLTTRQLKKPFAMEIEEVDQLEEVSQSILYVDKETLNHRLQVRKWRKGDYFYPLGMSGKKLVSKFFKDEKMNTLEKESQYLLFSGDQLVWVIGRRADRRFAVGPKTSTILRFKLKG